MFVFTPKGEVMALPAGSTPVDFAYAVHTEVGHRTIGARVNGKLVPLNSELNHGDWVEIFTSKAEGAGPSQDWQHFVKSARARNKIRQWFTKERREEAIDKGKDLLTKAMRKQNLPLQKLMTHDALTAVAQETASTPTSPRCTPAVGDGHTSAQNVIEHLVERSAVTAPRRGHDARPRSRSCVHAGQQGPIPTPASSSAAWATCWVKLARCCTPVPPDPILGFVTRGSGVSVHRTDCTNVRSCWTSRTGSSTSSGRPRSPASSWWRSRSRRWTASPCSPTSPGCSPRTTSTSSPRACTPPRDRVAISRFAFEMGDPKYLSHVLSAVRRIDGVFDVYRTTGGPAPHLAARPGRHGQAPAPSTRSIRSRARSLPGRRAWPSSRSEQPPGPGSPAPASRAGGPARPAPRPRGRTARRPPRFAAAR